MSDGSASSAAHAFERVGPRDLEALLALNQANTPEVGELDADRLARLVDQASLALLSRDGSGSPDGFVVVLGPGADYESPNYRYFESRYADHHYVDRIAIGESSRGKGLGRRFYDAVFDHARREGATLVTCEVNLEPPNPVSLGFHRALGFVDVAQQDTYGGTVRVQLMARRIDPTG